MPRWEPTPVWKGEDAYIIGGGDSLRQFDWDLLRGMNTIGCNGSYKLGVDICNVTLFGDDIWWTKFGKEGTLKYAGIVVGCSPRLHDKFSDPRLMVMDRKHTPGLGVDTLGWHGNTGAMAINLALILGASRVFLLGFDMKLGKDGQANWHDERYEPNRADVYPSFCRQMHPIVASLPEVFPGCQIINVTDDSELNLFPKDSIENHFSVVREGV